METEKPIYISLTSIYQNQKKLLNTLISITKQTILPNKIFIFLSAKPYLLDGGFPDMVVTDLNLLEFILSLTTIKIEFRFVENTGSYRKLLPLLKDKWNEDCIIITIDDDTEYDNNLIKNLVADYNIHKCVIGYRGFTPQCTVDLKDLRYNSRQILIPKYKYNFPTGKGGILYHPSFFYSTGDLIFNKELYSSLCPTADDVWFMILRVLNSVDCFLGTKSYMIKDNTSSNSLYSKYNSKQNDVQIQNTLAKLIELGYYKDPSNEK